MILTTYVCTERIDSERKRQPRQSDVSAFWFNSRYEMKHEKMKRHSFRETHIVLVRVVSLLKGENGRVCDAALLF